MAGAKIILIDPQKDERWDQFVERHPHGWLCHLSGWKLLLERCFSHIKGFYIVKVNSPNNEICAGLPIFKVNSFLTGKRLVSIPFGTLCDPLYYHETDLQEITDSAIQLGKQYKPAFIEIRNFKTNSLAEDPRFRATLIFKNHYLNLTDDLESIKKRFHRSCVRQRIDRALKSNLTLKLGESEDDLRRFYRLYLITRKRNQVPSMPYHFVKSIWEIFQPSGKISLLLAEHENTVIAALLMFKYKDRVSVEFAGSDDSYKSVSPNHFLFWKAINISKAEGYSLFDFGRTSPNNRQLMDFKAHWGTRVADILHHYYFGNFPNNLKYPEDKFTYAAVQTLTRVVPMFFYPVFGKMCYRHLG